MKERRECREVKERVKEGSEGGKQIKEESGGK